MRRTMTCLLLAVMVGLALAQSVTLDWDDNIEADLSHYIVYRGVETGVLWPMSVYVPSIAEILTSTYVDTSVQTDSTYYYAVTAVDNDDNESSESSEISVTLDFTAPDTSSFAAVVFDTTNASNVMLDLAAVADEAALASWQWREAYDGTWTPTSDQWVATDDHSDTTFATSLSDTIYTTLATSAMDSAQVRFRLKDANQNVSDWYGPFDNEFVREDASGSPKLYIIYSDNHNTDSDNITISDADNDGNGTITYDTGSYTGDYEVIESSDCTYGELDQGDPNNANTGDQEVNSAVGLPHTSGKNILMYFPLGGVAGTASVDSATVLYYGNGGWIDAGDTLFVYGADDSDLVEWVDESDVSYNYSDVSATTAWGTAISTYDSFTGTDLTILQAERAPSDWYHLAATNAVTRWIDDGQPNAGFWIDLGTADNVSDWHIIENHSNARSPVLLLYVQE